MMLILVAFAMCITTTEASKASMHDLSRAHRRTPGGRVIGEGHVGMTKKLNAALRAMKGATLSECASFSVEQLVALQRELHGARDPELETIYRNSGDTGRSMRAFGKRTDNINELEMLWEKESQTLAKYPWLVDATRDEKCHEAVMWFVHHVPQDVQVELRNKVVLPLLPERERHVPKEVPGDVSAKFERLGCDEVHTKGQDANNHQYVKWPVELTYTATAHGAFPFWDNSGGAGVFGCKHCDQDFTATTLKVRYSSKFNSEILMHETCGDMTWTGGAGAPKHSPCNHIFSPTEGSFIYTPKMALEPEADGKFCCRSVAKDSDQMKGAVPRDWSKSGQYMGTYDNFKGDHYSGTIKMFEWPQNVHPFWYYTKPDGTPVQQGESCDDPHGDRPHKCGQGQPPTSWHDFVPGTFKEATFAASDFAIPAVCKGFSLKNCLVPGNSLHVVV